MFDEDLQATATVETAVVPMMIVSVGLAACSADGVGSTWARVPAT